MKKTLLFSLVLIMCLMLAACGNNNQGTYYPDSNEMQSNLEGKNYTVCVSTMVQNDSTITVLTATKGNEFIDFYWFDNDKEVDDIATSLESKHDGYVKLVSIKNDDKFGNLIFCSTEKAMEDSGIVIAGDVKVNVDVKVNID